MKLEKRRTGVYRGEYNGATLDIVRGDKGLWSGAARTDTFRTLAWAEARTRRTLIAMLSAAVDDIAPDDD